LLLPKRKTVTGPPFLGIDTHGLSEPAFITALEVLAANGIKVMIQKDFRYTLTPVISHTILTCNRGRRPGLADGKIITPSHNSPDNGGFKYNPPHGGPADTHITQWIENKANEILLSSNKEVKTVPYEKIKTNSIIHERDYIEPYIKDLKNIIDIWMP